MLSFSGRWLQSEQDDSTDPRGWCVKRYGKTWINRGPGILPDWMWPKLWLDPMGEIKDRSSEVETKPCCSYCYACVLWKVSAEVLSTVNCALVLFFGDLCSIWGNQLVSNEWWKLHGATEARDLYQGQLSDGHDLSVMLPYSTMSFHSLWILHLTDLSQLRGNYLFSWVLFHCFPYYHLTT